MNTKKCFKCNKKRTLSEFYKHAQMKDGHLNKCKICTKKDVKDNSSDYDTTEKGVIRIIYKTQRFNSKRRKHPMPSYSKQELKEWLYEKGFKELYDDWIFSGYLKSQKPSIDRLDDFKHYSISNIRLVKWKDNKDKQTDDILLGRSTSGLRCKPLYQYDSNGGLLAEYVSFAAAKRVLKYSMYRSIQSGKTDRKGFKWRYKKNG